MMHVSYYAHVRENDTGGKEFQTAAQHLAGTAELCRAFAAPFGAVMTSYIKNQWAEERKRVRARFRA